MEGIDGANGSVKVGTEVLAQCARFRTRAIVGQKQDQRVLEAAHSFQLVHQPADISVHAVHLRRINRHLQVHFIPLRVTESGPLRRFGVGWRQRPCRVNQAKLFHPLVTVRTQCRPAVPVAAPVPGDIRLVGVQRPVRRVIGEVQEERRILRVRFEHGQGAVRKNVRCIKTFTARS
ncbi:MAG: hypothetical protein BWX80_04121 [Candidatus Hydrogenedentes bacterium ADurb.Bin101]|nr:MAG: hypothetical protein BWX80_04121 [Candidatus Hydrogenedentes bacterium ADurb.Bin101]